MCTCSQVQSILEKMESWDFDIFALHEATNGHSLVVGGMHLLTSMGVLDKIPIPKDKLATYLQAIERTRRRTTRHAPPRAATRRHAPPRAATRPHAPPRALPVDVL